MTQMAKLIVSYNMWGSIRLFVFYATYRGEGGERGWGMGGLKGGVGYWVESVLDTFSWKCIYERRPTRNH